MKSISNHNVRGVILTCRVTALMMYALLVV